MGLEIETRRKEKQMTEGKYVLEEELYKTEDGDVVRAGTGRAAFLYKPVGGKITLEEAIELGLTDGNAAETATDDSGDGAGDQAAELSELKRPELDAKAVELGIEDPDKLPNKGAVVKAIEEKLAETATDDSGDGAGE
jgi:hypothetical protein